MKPIDKTDNKKFMQELFEKFESVRRDQEDIEYWLARDLQEIFGYSRWESFIAVINRSKEACKNSNHEITDHFRQVAKMVSIEFKTKVMSEL